MIMLLEIVKNLWLNDKQAKVYLSLLEIGTSPVTRISSKSGINRSSCYDILQDLIQLGYIQKTQKKWIVQFAATLPEILAEQLKQKHATFENALPLFHELINSYSIRPAVRIADGLEWVKNIYRDLLTEKKEILSFIGSEIQDAELLNFINHQFITQRVCKKIKQRILSTDLKDQKRAYKIDKKFLREKIKINSKDLSLVCGIHIYATDKIMINLFQKSDMVAMIIESKLLYQTLKSLFEYIRKINITFLKKA
jgi:sugar-specific transcriptional regulator TrmB